MQHLWYPATYIYGFVEGCWKTVEENQTLQKHVADDIRAVCGCAIDAIRHAMPFHEAESQMQRQKQNLISLLKCASTMYYGSRSRNHVTQW